KKWTGTIMDKSLSESSSSVSSNELELMQMNRCMMHCDISSLFVTKLSSKTYVKDRSWNPLNSDEEVGPLSPLFVSITTGLSALVAATASHAFDTTRTRSQCTVLPKSSLLDEAVYDKEKSRVSWPKQLNASLEEVDPEIADIIELEMMVMLLMESLHQATIIQLGQILQM
ncbi:hypothetical protein S83_058899, partial [Arachis hypogaea]